MIDKRVGVIGLGNMGRGLVKNLLEKSYSVSMFDSNSDAMDLFKKDGAKPAGSIAELVSHSTFIITCLPTLEAIRDVYLGPNGIVASAETSATVIDCSTSDPQLTQEIGAKLKKLNVSLLDAPMLRTPAHAWAGSLHLVVGGERDVLDHAREVLDAFAEKIYYVGELGNGHTIKLINNAMTIGTHVVVCEALVAAKKLGLDLSVVQEVAEVSMASSKKLSELAPRLINDDHTLSFATDVALKDINTFAELATRNDAHVSVIKQARDLLQLTSTSGFGSESLSRTATVLERLTATGDATANS